MSGTPTPETELERIQGPSGWFSRERGRRRRARALASRADLSDLRAPGLGGGHAGGGRRGDGERRVVVGLEVTVADVRKAPRLIVITDRESGPLDVWLRHLEELLAGAAPGSVQVMLRDRQLAIRERRHFGELLRQLTEQHHQSLSVSDRLDLAVLLRADAVHLSEASVSTADARAFARLHGQRWAVSAAAHAPERWLTASDDALLLSPVMAPRKGRPALGLEALRQARLASRQRPEGLGACRLFALGGVTSGNARALLDAGADGVALIGELFEPGAPSALVRALGIPR